jgi:phenylpyruvate tautomerase PptA (4-oxalocrotonate tautomerase family)
MNMNEPFRKYAHAAKRTFRKVQAEPVAELVDGVTRAASEHLDEVVAS